MMNVKEELLKSYRHSLELAKDRIAELPKPTIKSLAHSRSAERDFWKKRVKHYENKIKELEEK